MADGSVAAAHRGALKNFDAGHGIPPSLGQIGGNPQATIGRAATTCQTENTKGMIQED